MMSYLKLFLLVLPLVILLDFIWIGLLMKGFYDQELGDLARRQNGSLAPRWPAAILVYVLIPAGIVLAMRPHLSDTVPYWQIAAWGAAFGLILYGVYDLTNYALLEKWSLRVTLADLGWGTLLCCLCAMWMQAAARWLQI